MSPFLDFILAMELVLICDFRSYMFAQPSDGPAVFGISHASEIKYVFGFVSPDAAGDMEVSTNMRQYW